jgi:OTU domain-containing protein 5
LLFSGYQDWDEDDILAQVLAQSQQEYLDSLKKNSDLPPFNS